MKGGNMMNKKQYKNSDYIIYEDGRCYSNKTHKFLTPKMSVKYPTYSLTLDGCKKNIKIQNIYGKLWWRCNNIRWRAINTSKNLN